MRWGAVTAQAGRNLSLCLSCLALGLPICPGNAQGQSNFVEPGTDVGPLTIRDAVILTLSRHPDIARGLAAVARGRADLGAARSVWLPQLSYQANLGPNMLSGKSGSGLNDNMAGPTVALNQMIWDFGRSKGEIGYAASTERQRQFELEATADTLAERGALAFLDVKRFELLAEETSKHVASLKRLRGLIALRVDAGLSDRSDLLLADVRVESARGDESLASASMISAKVSLANLIGVMPANYRDPAPEIARFEEHEGEPDFKRLPTIAAAEQAEKAAAGRVGQARAESYPRLGLQLGYSRNNYTYNDRDNAFTAMVTIGGDLFKRGNRYRVRAAEEDRRAASATRESAIFDLRGRALAAREDIRGGYQRIEAYRSQERLAVAARGIFFEEYKLGKRSLTDLLNAELEIYRAASARINAEYSVMNARIRYENVYGELRPSLGLPATLDEGGDND